MGLVIIIDILFGDFIENSYDTELWILIILTLIVSFGLDLLKKLKKKKNERKD